MQRSTKHLINSIVILVFFVATTVLAQSYLGFGSNNEQQSNVSTQATMLKPVTSHTVLSPQDFTNQVQQQSQQTQSQLQQQYKQQLQQFNATQPAPMTGALNPNNTNMNNSSGSTALPTNQPPTPVPTTPMPAQPAVAPTSSDELPVDNSDLSNPDNQAPVMAPTPPPVGTQMAPQQPAPAPQGQIYTGFAPATNGTTNTAPANAPTSSGSSGGWNIKY